MQYASIEEKNAFYSAEQKQLLLKFDDGRIVTNEDIAMESMNLEQTLCDQEELRFGKVSAACFKTQVVASIERYRGCWFEVVLQAGGFERPLGRFCIESDELTADRKYRDIVAYDAMYWAMNTDVTDWYNKLSFPITQKAFRDSLFTYLGLEQEETVLLNDNITFEKTVNAENFTGLTVMEALCEINASWGVMNAFGQFRYVQMRTLEHDALYPHENLYPSDDLFPDDIYDDVLSKADYYQGGLKYTEYDTQPIAKVIIRENADDVGYSHGADGNTYVIEGNFLLYGASNNTLQTVAANFYSRANYIAYTPSEISCKGAPWREVGDLLLVHADGKSLAMPILRRQLSGITALSDVYAAKGAEYYGENINSTSEQLKQLKGRTNKLMRTLDETRSEISQFETDVNGQLEEMSSSIKQTAESINLKVSKGDVVSEINNSAEQITLTSNRVVINSDKWKVNADGSQSCSDITVTGGSFKVGSNFNVDTSGNVVANSLKSSNATITGGSIDLTGDGDNSIKFTLTTEGGVGWKIAPSTIEHIYDENVRLRIAPLAGTIILYDSNGNITVGLSSVGITTAGIISSGGMTTTGNVNLNNEKYIRGKKTSDEYANMLKMSDTNTVNLGNTTCITRLYGTTVALRGGSTDISSDERAKKDFGTLERFEEFFMDLNPCEFKYLTGTSDRYHIGFGANGVKEALEANKLSTQDFAGYVESEMDKEFYMETLGYLPFDSDTELSLRYAEFIALNTHMIQKTIKELNETKAELASLQEKYDTLAAVVDTLKSKIE